MCRPQVVVLLKGEADSGGNGLLTGAKVTRCLNLARGYEVREVLLEHPNPVHRFIHFP
jgi:hypothetical protein